MIVSASRRTDLPAFYTEWLMGRIRAGWCTVTNPYNPKQVRPLSLRPQDVEAMVFWSKNPKPLVPHLAELENRGLRYYFQFTITGYGSPLEPHVPDVEQSLNTFANLSRNLGRERVIWRYDPILFSQMTGISYHRHNFMQLAHRLEGYTTRVVVSLLDCYQKTIRELRRANMQVEQRPAGVLLDDPSCQELLVYMAQVAREHGMEIQSCAQGRDLSPYGIQTGKCIDDDLIFRLFGIRVGAARDRSQRPHCACILSRDIGVYHTCLHGCRYCYATANLETARRNYHRHNPLSPVMLDKKENPTRC